MNRVRHKILVLGGGHAGVRAARRLRERDVALASRENAELWHGLMPQVLSGALQPQHALVPLREVLPGMRIYNREVLNLDLDARTALLGGADEGDELEVQYEYLVVALGSILDVTRFPGMAEHSLPTKSIADFFHLRNHVISCLERANEQPDGPERERLLTFVIAGAGFGGVEVASELADLVQREQHLYGNLAPGSVRIVCVDVAERVLPSVAPELSAQAAAYLRALGIELRLRVGVASATAREATLSDGSRVATASLIATAGTGVNPVVRRAGLPLWRGRVACDVHGRVDGHAKVYAAGDAAGIPDPAGQPYPPVVTFAIREGDLVGANILHELRGEPLDDFQHQVVAQVGILTRSFGIAQVRGRLLRGRAAALFGKWTFLSLMPSWNRRARLALDWTTSRLLGGDTSSLQVSGSGAVRRMRFNAGDTIVQEGDVGSYFYIVLDGQVEVVEWTEAGEHTVRRLGPRDHFGELALREETGRRTAAVRALTDTHLVAIARADFSALSEAIPELA